MLTRVTGGLSDCNKERLRGGRFDLTVVKKSAR